MIRFRGPSWDARTSRNLRAHVSMKQPPTGERLQHAKKQKFRRQLLGYVVFWKAEAEHNIPATSFTRVSCRDIAAIRVR